MHHFLLVSGNSKYFTIPLHEGWLLMTETIHIALLLVEASCNLTTTSDFQDEYYSLHTSLS